MLKFIAALLIVFLSSACTNAKKEAATTTVKPVIIATVNGEEISFGQLKKIYKTQRIDLQNAEGPVATARQIQKENLLNNQIDQLLLLQAAQKHQITVKDEDLNMLFENITAAWETSEFETELAQRGHTLETFKEELRKNIMVSAYLSQEVYARVDVTEQEVLEKYQENPQQYVQEEAVKLSQILVPSEELAHEVITNLNKGTKFEEAAANYSVGSESTQGGAMGWIERGNLPPDIEEKVFALKNGKISEVITSEYGYHIFLVSEHRQQKELKFDQVKDTIAQTVRADKEQQAQETIIANLRQDAHITINKQLLDNLD